MDHREASIAFIRSTGLIPVKVRPRQKDAYPDWDPRNAVSQDHLATIRHLSNGTDDNLAALFFGRYIDIDIDSPEPLITAALDQFLPKTPFMWGRASKPFSHRVYQLQENFERAPYGPILRYLKSEFGVEFRGGVAENGMYSVLPGSIHPSGESYEWGGEIDPTISVTTAPTHVLIRSMRLAVAAAAIAKYWQPGSRNEMGLALSGLMWRIRTNSLMALNFENESQVEDQQFLLTEIGAKNLFSTVMELAGDDEADRRSRMISFTNTWKKLTIDPSAKVTGGVALAALIGEDGDKVVKGLYRLLSDNPDIEQLDKLIDQFVMWYGPGVVIDLDMVNKGRTTPWMQKEQAINSLAGNKISFGDKKVPAAVILFSSPMVRRVQGITFDPSTTEQIIETVEGTMVNQWRGFETEPSTQRVTDHEVDHFTDYIRNTIAHGNEERYSWVMSWLADLLQHPEEKPGTSLVLVGVQGAGKSFLGEKIIQPIIGKSHSSQTNSIAQLTDRFNTIVDNKIFLQCDEAIHSYQKDVAAKLKSLITDTALTIEPKFVNSFRKPNHMRILFTSNEEHSAMFIDASPYERRFTVIQVSPHRAKSSDYWIFMHKWVRMNLHKIMRWLLDYKYDKDLIRRPLNTKAKATMQRVGLDAEISWIVNRMGSGNILSERTHRHWFDSFDPTVMATKDQENDTILRMGWPKLVNIAALEADFKEYVRGHGRPVYSGSVLTLIRRVMPEKSLEYVKSVAASYYDSRTGQITRTTIKLHAVPSIEDITRNLVSKYGSIIEELATNTVVIPEGVTDAHSEEF